MTGHLVESLDEDASVNPVTPPLLVCEIQNE